MAATAKASTAPAPSRARVDRVDRRGQGRPQHHEAEDQRDQDGDDAAHRGLGDHPRHPEDPHPDHDGQAEGGKEPGADEPLERVRVVAALVGHRLRLPVDRKMDRIDIAHTMRCNGATARIARLGRPSGHRGERPGLGDGPRKQHRGAREAAPPVGRPDLRRPSLPPVERRHHLPGRPARPGRQGRAGTSRAASRPTTPSSAAGCRPAAGCSSPPGPSGSRARSTSSSRSATPCRSWASTCSTPSPGSSPTRRPTWPAACSPTPPRSCSGPRPCGRSRSPTGSTTGT